MNEIELNRLKIELNSKTLHTKNKNIYLNLTEIKSIKKRSLDRAQKTLLQASNKNYVDTKEIHNINNDIQDKQTKLLNYLEYYEEFKTSCNTKEEETK